MFGKCSGFLLQATYGRQGNFEVVTDSPNDGYRGLLHRFRNNDLPGFPWIFAGHFYRQQWTIRWPSVLQERDLASGRLHVVALCTGADGRSSLRHFRRENNPTWAWAEPEELPDSAGLSYSGNPVFIESGASPAESWEVVAALSGGGLVHWQHRGGSWTSSGPFGNHLGRIDALALIESSFGRLELILRRGTGLSHMSRPLGAGNDAWGTPVSVFDGAAGVPGFIQSRHGRNGNFEIVTADRSGGLTLLWRNNDDPASPAWQRPFAVCPRIGDPADIPGDGDAVGLIQSNYGTPGIGNLEVILRRGGKSYFLWRQDAPPWTWAAPYRIATDPAQTRSETRNPLGVTGTLESRLASYQDLRNEITWETATGERHVYDDWTRAQKDRLNRLFQALLEDREDLGLRLPDAGRNMGLRAQVGGQTAMFLTADEAFDIYAAHVAHVLYLEAAGLVPWSIFDLPSAELQELLSSDRYHIRILPSLLDADPSPYYPSHIHPNVDFQLPYRVWQSGHPIGLLGDPRDGYFFLQGRRSTSRANRIGRTEEETLANICYWFAENVGHGGFAIDNDRDYRIRHTFLRDRLRFETREERNPVNGTITRSIGVFAQNGCHSAATLFHDLARSVNIPVLCIGTTIGGENHQGLVFRWNRPATRLLPHADDLYNANRYAPFFGLRGDGSSITPGEAPQYFFENVWPTLDTLRRFNYSMPVTFDLRPHSGTISPYGLPDTGVYGGQFPSSQAKCGWDLRRRYDVCSWWDFLYPFCTPINFDALLATAGSYLSPPRADFERRGSQCVVAYGECSRLQQQYTDWGDPSHFGRDPWRDP